MIQAVRGLKQCTDHELAKRVTKSLRRHVSLSGIDVDVINATVILCGTVSSDRQRHLAISACARIPGVGHVVDHLVVLDCLPCEGRFDCSSADSCCCHLTGQCPSGCSAAESAFESPVRASSSEVRQNHARSESREVTHVTRRQ
jgi:hypothetical protein